MKITCPYCHNRWFMTPEALAIAADNSPKKGRSIGVECPSCRKLVKVARPKNLPKVEPDKDEPARKGEDKAST